MTSSDGPHGNRSLFTDAAGIDYVIVLEPMRCRTNLHVIDPQNPLYPYSIDTLPESAPALARAIVALAIEDHDYHWDTPRYRTLCEEAGLDPDYHRPRFKEGYEDVGQVLMRLLNTIGSCSIPVQNVLSDLVDLIRTDGPRGMKSINDVRAEFAVCMKYTPAIGYEVLMTLERLGAARLLTDV